MNENSYNSYPQGQNYQNSQNQQGQQVQQPRQGVQTGQQTQSGYTPQPTPYSVPQPAPAPAPKPAPTSEKKGNGKLIPVLLVILALFTIANTALLAFTLMGNNGADSAQVQLKESKLYNDYSEGIAEKCLEIDDFEITYTDEYSSDFELSLENKSSRDLADVYIYYSGYDSRGDCVASSYTYLPYIEADTEMIVTDYLSGANIQRIEITRYFAVYASDLYN